MSAQGKIQAAIDRAVAQGRHPAKIGAPARALHVRVPGLPLPKGSPAILRNRKTGKPFTRESPACVGWQEVVRQLARSQARRTGFEPLDCPVCVQLHFTLPRKRSAPKSATGTALAAVKPDLDKLTRAILDALEGVAYTTDSRVVELACAKWAGPKPGVEITVMAHHLVPLW